MATGEDTDVVVSQEDFMAALKELVASVSSTEMEHYGQIQQRFTNRSIHDS
jgi:peroxin-6